jgi:hypothetical protein
VERTYSEEAILNVCLDLLAQNIYPNARALVERLPRASGRTLVRIRDELADRGRLLGFTPRETVGVRERRRREIRDGIDPGTEKGWKEYMKRRNKVYRAVCARGRSLTEQELDDLFGPEPGRNHERKRA